jgi:hypothetical protein
MTYVKKEFSFVIEMLGIICGEQGVGGAREVTVQPNDRVPLGNEQMCQFSVQILSVLSMLAAPTSDRMCLGGVESNWAPSQAFPWRLLSGLIRLANRPCGGKTVAHYSNEDVPEHAHA